MRSWSCPLETTCSLAPAYMSVAVFVPMGAEFSPGVLSPSRPVGQCSSHGDGWEGDSSVGAVEHHPPSEISGEFKFPILHFLLMLPGFLTGLKLPPPESQCDLEGTIQPYEEDCATSICHTGNRGSERGAISSRSHWQGQMESMFLTPSPCGLSTRATGLLDFGSSIYIERGAVASRIAWCDEGAARLPRL
jgi:hypothetical protein